MQGLTLYEQHWGCRVLNNESKPSDSWVTACKNMQWGMEMQGQSVDKERADIKRVF